MKIFRQHRRQRGAVIVTVALLMMFLLGFMGFALDFARTFVVKTELQTAMDSCALSAAQELDGTADAITRAVSAGLTAGNVNGVNFQSLTWAGKGQVTSGDVTFRDGTYTVTTNPTMAKYAQCAHTHPAMDLWLIKAMNAFMGGIPTTQDVGALAVAKRGSAQTTCPVPLAMKPKIGGVAPDYGFVVGEWVTLIVAPGGGTNGQIGWANLDGSSSASQTEAEMDGYCGSRVGDTLGTPGVQSNVADNWNYRFGIYRNTSVDQTTAITRPDLSGYAYTSNNWPGSPPSNAYDGPTPVGSPSYADAANFVTKRLAFASCANTTTDMRGGPPGSPTCENITAQDLNSFNTIAVPNSTAAGHRKYGTNRRIVIVPVVNGSMNVIDYVCMFMLQPMSLPPADVKLEYRGNAGATGSPCTTAGLPGGVAGPLVPVLVR
jgi:Flp pilus assembly protein TadG